MKFTTILDWEKTLINKKISLINEINYSFNVDFSTPYSTVMENDIIRDFIWSILLENFKLGFRLCRFDIPQLTLSSGDKTK